MTDLSGSQPVKARASQAMPTTSDLLFGRSYLVLRYVLNTGKKEKYKMVISFAKDSFSYIHVYNTYIFVYAYIFLMS